MSKKQDPVFKAHRGMSGLDAYQLTREVCTTQGWYAIQVPAWRNTSDRTAYTYWVKVCGFVKGKQTKWHYLDSREQWETLKAECELPPEPAACANVPPSTCSATEVPNTPVAIDTLEVSALAPLKTSKCLPSS